MTITALEEHLSSQIHLGRYCSCHRVRRFLQDRSSVAVASPQELGPTREISPLPVANSEALNLSISRLRARRSSPSLTAFTSLTVIPATTCWSKRACL